MLLYKNFSRVLLIHMHLSNPALTHPSVAAKKFFDQILSVRNRTCRHVEPPVGGEHIKCGGPTNCVMFTIT